MNPKFFAAGLLVAGLATAAAGGAYVAVRQNTAAQAVPAAVPAPPASAVTETEAVIGTPVAPEPAAEPATPAPQAAPPEPSNPIAAPERPRTRPVAPVSPRRSEPAPTVQASAQPVAEERPEPPAVAAPVPEPVPEVKAPEVPPAPPEPQFEELVVPASAIIGLQVETALSSERSQVEDRVEARVTRDVTAAGRVAIPAGSRVIGAVSLVERGGKMKDRARLGVRFHTLVLANGHELPLRTEAIYREGDSPGNESARKIGGAAAGGAILGAILGGGKGAAIGGAVGAAGGSAVVMAGDRNAASLPAGSVVNVRLSAPATLEVEKR